MAIDERARHQLYRKLEEVLGPDDASVLMEHLPPAGWGDVATKRDLDHLAETVDLKIESAKNELKASFNEALARQTRTMVFSFAMMFIGLVGLLLGVHFV